MVAVVESLTCLQVKIHLGIHWNFPVTDLGCWLLGRVFIRIRWNKERGRVLLIKPFQVFLNPQQQTPPPFSPSPPRFQRKEGNSTRVKRPRITRIRDNLCLLIKLPLSSVEKIKYFFKNLIFNENLFRERNCRENEIAKIVHIRETKRKIPLIDRMYRVNEPFFLCLRIPRSIPRETLFLTSGSARGNSPRKHSRELSTRYDCNFNPRDN